MKNYIYLVILFLAMTFSNTLSGQGFMDCARVLNLVDDPIDGGPSTPVIKQVNGITYVLVDDEGTIPVINAETPRAGILDIYIAAFDANCNQILGTYYGGNDNELISDFGVDAAGNVVVVGITLSTDFPTTDGTTYGGGGSGNIFITKFAPDGSIVYSSLPNSQQGNSAADQVAITERFILREELDHRVPIFSQRMAAV